MKLGWNKEISAFIFFFLDNMVESGCQSRVGARSIRVETSGGFCYEDDLDSKDLGKNGI